MIHRKRAISDSYHERSVPYCSMIITTAFYSIQLVKIIAHYTSTQSIVKVNCPASLRKKGSTGSSVSVTSAPS